MCKTFSFINYYYYYHHHNHLTVVQNCKYLFRFYSSIILTRLVGLQISEIIGSVRHFTSTNAMITSNCRDLRLSDCRWDAVNLFLLLRMCQKIVRTVLKTFQMCGM